MTVSDPYVHGRCSEIERLLNEAASWASNDARLGANLAAYITVLIVGVLEDCIEHLVAQRVQKTGDNEIGNYVGKVLSERFRNPVWGYISGLLGEFSEGYQRRFSQMISHNGSEASALMSIVSNKNELAHVGTWKLEMTVTDVTDYYHRIVPILEVLEQILA
ncbi:MAG: hypothetical protein Q8O86_03970 [Dehalococcoidia bacterium]|nr:hypothetical protein [Dehalococcoidia bacterium]